ncbi:MAG: TraR/DksA C4-type zinc finger protein [Actinomycetota bacterium]
MSPARKKTARKKPTARRSSAASKTSKKSRARKPTGAAKKATRKKTAAKKTTRKKTAARKKTPVKKTTRKKTAAKKSKRTTAKKTNARKSTAKRNTAKKRSGARATTPKPPTRRPARSAATKPTKKAPRRRAAKFDKAQLAAIRKELESERSGLQAQLDELTQDSFDGTQSEMTGEVGLDDDFADAGSATFERERDLSIQNNIRDLIDQTTRAIQRIDDGNYGTCERCGNPIEAARLKALPHALLCMDCKRREERAR